MAGYVFLKPLPANRVLGRARSFHTGQELPGHDKKALEEVTVMKLDALMSGGYVTEMKGGVTGAAVLRENRETAAAEREKGRKARARYTSNPETGAISAG